MFAQALLLLLHLLASTKATSTPCTLVYDNTTYYPQRVPAWACILCGPNTDQCLPYNATFEGLPVGKTTGKYDNITWTNFITEDNRQTTFADHIVPFSARNFARLPAGKTGVMQYSQGALMFNFHYGCTTPWSECSAAVREGTPVSCTISMSAYCGYDRYHGYKQSWSFNYTVDKSQRSTPMAFTNGNSYYGPGYGGCTNYTFTAKSSKGGAVDMFLDDVIYKLIPYF